MTYDRAREICFELKPTTFNSEIKFIQFTIDGKLFFQFKVRIQELKGGAVLTEKEFELMDEQIFKIIVEKIIERVLNQK